MVCLVSICRTANDCRKTTSNSVAIRGVEWTCIVDFEVLFEKRALVAQSYTSGHVWKKVLSAKTVLTSKTGILAPFSRRNGLILS